MSLLDVHVKHNYIAYSNIAVQSSNSLKNSTDYSHSGTKMKAFRDPVSYNFGAPMRMGPPLVELYGGPFS